MSTPSNPVPVSRLLRLAKEEWRLLLLASMALLVSTSASLIFPRAVGEMVNTVVQRGETAGLDRVAAFLLALFLVQALFSMVRSWLFTVAGERVVASLRKRLYEAVMRQDIGFFDTTRIGELTNRLSADTTVCLLYTSPSPRDATLSRMPSSA